MTNVEMMLSVLKDHSCLNSTEICGFIYRKFGVHVSPSSVSGLMRSLYSNGTINKGKDQNNKTVYWLT